MRAWEGTSSRRFLSHVPSLSFFYPFCFFLLSPSFSFHPPFSPFILQAHCWRFALWICALVSTGVPRIRVDSHRIQARENDCGLFLHCQCVALQDAAGGVQKHRKMAKSSFWATSSFLFLVVRPGATSSFLLLVAVPFVTSSFLLLCILFTTNLTLQSFLKHRLEMHGARKRKSTWNSPTERMHSEHLLLTICRPSS